MIKKLLNKMNFQTVSVSRNTSLLTSLFIIILYLGGVSNLQGQSATFSEASETLAYDSNECASFSGDNTPWEYSEFIATTNTSRSSI